MAVAVGGGRWAVRTGVEGADQEGLLSGGVAALGCDEGDYEREALPDRVHADMRQAQHQPDQRPPRHHRRP